MTLTDIMSLVTDLLAIPAVAVTLTLAVGTFAASRIISLIRRK